MNETRTEGTTLEFRGSGILENDAAFDVQMLFDELIENGESVNSAVEAVIIAKELERETDDSFEALCRAAQILSLAWFALATTPDLPERLVMLVEDVVKTGDFTNVWTGTDEQRAEKQQSLVVAIMEGRETFPDDGERWDDVQAEPAKEAWMLTKAEFTERSLVTDQPYRDALKNTPHNASIARKLAVMRAEKAHSTSVLHALKDGNDVPTVVLSDYGDWQKLKKQPEPDDDQGEIAVYDDESSDE